MVNKMNKIFLWFTIWMFFGSGLAFAGPYTDSAHGNSDYGVKRSATGFPVDYTNGHCANCHEQHSSINSSEPSPDGGPDNYLLFDTSHTSQTANFCFDCHTDTASQQSDGFIKNYSYAYRAGNYDDSAGNDDIKQAFDNISGNASSHNLNDIRTFITGKWGYTSNSNPCCACHNPHAAQGDPANSTNQKSSSTRGYPVSRPSNHSVLASWGLWGNESGEKMSKYTLYYQAPYRFGEIASYKYEPDGSTTIMDGSNLTDYVTFCLDCHYPYQPQSTLLGTLKVINWETSVHGKAESWKQNDAAERKAPYNSAVNRNYVLACTDCHEPHGSTNYCYLIRNGINGNAATVTGNTKAYWNSLCSRCHTQSHADDDDESKKNDSCITCHYHGAIDSATIKSLF